MHAVTLSCTFYHLPRPLFPTFMTASCAKVGEWEAALYLFGHLRAGMGDAGEALEADTVSFNATINALGRGGQWEKALVLLREMVNAGGRIAVSRKNTGSERSVFNLALVLLQHAMVGVSFGEDSLRSVRNYGKRSASVHELLYTTTVVPCHYLKQYVTCWFA